ncbi:MAG: EamA family transporter [Desulfobacterium sp.]|jgi:drug/metabolite transporter (DMT)-like permease|nr:EamA family transporter [Desulfobacterium sp.]
MDKLGYIYILAAATLWGFLGPFGKMAFQEGVSPLEVAFWRAMLAWLLFAAQAFYQRRVRVNLRDLPGLALFGFLCVTMFFGSYQIAVEKGGAAMASVLLYTAPAWVFLLSRFFLNEGVNLKKITALGLTLAGVILISRNQQVQAMGIAGEGGISAVLFGLLAGFCYSLYYIFGKHFSDKYSASVLFLYILPFGAVCLLPWFSFAQKSVTAWLALGAIAVFSTFASYHFYYAGLRRIEAGRASIIATAEPVVAALVAWCWWGESFTVYGYFGSVLILAAVLLMIRS